MIIPRYFTVYSPAGRSDLSGFRFAQWITEERPVRVNAMVPNRETSRSLMTSLTER